MKTGTFSLAASAMLLLLTACGHPGTGKPANRTEAESSAQICGGYTTEREPTPEEITMFRRVTADVPKVFTPLAVATQVVAGTNYRFRCTYRDEAGGGNCLVVIFKPLPGQGEPSLKELSEQPDNI